MAVILAFFILGSLWASFRPRFFSIEVDWSKKSYQVILKNAFFSKSHHATFVRREPSEVSTIEYSEGTEYVANLTLDGKTFPIKHFSKEADAQTFTRLLDEKLVDFD